MTPGSVYWQYKQLQIQKTENIRTLEQFSIFGSKISLKPRFDSSDVLFEGKTAKKFIFIDLSKTLKTLDKIWLTYSLKTKCQTPNTEMKQLFSLK